jgi:hypothetical protein
MNPTRARKEAVERGRANRSLTVAARIVSRFSCTV